MSKQLPFIDFGLDYFLANLQALEIGQLISITMETEGLQADALSGEVESIEIREKTVRIYLIPEMQFTLAAE